MTIAGVVFGIAIAVAGYFIWTRKLRNTVSGMPNIGKVEVKDSATAGIVKPKGPVGPSDHTRDPKV